MEALAPIVASLASLPLAVQVLVPIALVLIALVALVWRSLSAPPPAGGSAYKLPNGMTIQHWQAGETDFLYKEIWGAESAYSSRGGIIFRPGAVILDAGANIGMFSLYAAAAARGRAHIVSFEPIPSTYAVLAANARSAEAGAFAEAMVGDGTPAPPGSLRMEVLNVGLSSKPARVVFEHHPHFSVWSTSDATFAEARLERITEDLPRALDSSTNACVRSCFPRAFARALARLVLRSKMGKTERVPVSLVTLSSVIDARPELREGDIDLLKVDVEGAEVDVLKGIKPAHWERIQQVALEVESFAVKDEVCAILKNRGFETDWFASERERNPGVHSEVSMVYGIRSAYRAAHGGGGRGLGRQGQGGRRALHLAAGRAAPRQSASECAVRAIIHSLLRHHHTSVSLFHHTHTHTV